MLETYLKDPLDIFRDKDARGDFETEDDPPKKPICEFCNEYCDGDIAFELERNYWLCIPCLQKAVKRIPLN